MKIGDRVQVKRDADSVFAGRRGHVTHAAHGGYLVKLRNVTSLLYFVRAELEADKRNEPR